MTKLRLDALPVANLVAASLLTAFAALKSWQLVHQLSSVDLLFNSPTLTFAFIVFEGLLGLWVLTNLTPVTNRRILIFVFGVFALYSCGKMVQTSFDCGCFGSYHLSPALTLVLDGFVLIALHRMPHGRPFFANPGLGLAIFASVAFWLTIILHARVDQILKSTVVNINRSLVVGQSASFLTNVSVGNRLARGDWKLIFYRTDCHFCVEAVPTYEELARRSRSASNLPKLAMIEVPPAHAELSKRMFDHNLLLAGVLNPALIWRARTPTIVTVHDGIIMSVD